MAVNGCEIACVCDTEPVSGCIFPEKLLQQQENDALAVLLCDDGAGQGKGLGGLYPEVQKKSGNAAGENNKRPRSESLSHSPRNFPESHHVRARQKATTS
jgi:hypothetical protein